MTAMREMTLEEYLESKLPPFHLARRQLQELREERDALAAHVERLEDIIERSTLADSPAAESALEDTPETSLARIKALWMAEGAQRAADSIRYDYDGHIHQDRIAEHVDDVALELRRQAEGGEV